MKAEFYNTIGLQGDLFTMAKESAANQAVNILDVFKRLGEPLTPAEVLKCLEAKGFIYPITSVRRAITDLTASGELVKCSEMRPGLYGQPNHTWRAKAA